METDMLLYNLCFLEVIKLKCRLMSDIDV